MEVSLRTLIPLFRPGSVHSGYASWDDCDRVFPDDLRVSLFPDRFPHYAWTAAWSAHSDFVESKVYACLGVTCHRDFWQNDQGILRAAAVIRGWSGHRIKVSTQSWLWSRKFSNRSCWDSNSQPFTHESGALTNKLSRLCNAGVWVSTQLRVAQISHCYCCPWTYSTTTSLVYGAVKSDYW